MSSGHPDESTVTDYRTLRVWEAIAEYAGTRGAALSVGTVTAACADRAAMSGAWVTRGPLSAGPAFASDPVAERVADLQFLLGEGPAVDALRDGSPVVAADLGAVAGRRAWPVFAPAALTTGARSVLAVPMLAGTSRIGLFGLFSFEPTEPSAEQLAEVVTFAEVAVGLILNRIRHVPRDVDRWLSDGRAVHRAEVHQATGIVAAQLGIGVTESLARLRAHAYAQGKPLIEIARQVVTQRLRLSTDTPKRFIPRP